MIYTKNKKIILFDAYGTLFNEGKESVPKIAEEIIKELNLKISSKYFFNEWKKNYLNIENEVFSNDKLFKTIKEMNLESLALTFDKFLINNSPLKFIEKLFNLWSFPKLFPEVETVLNILRKDFFIGILSNTDNETLFSAINYTKLKLDYILTSEKAGSYKPNVDIFLNACNDLSLNNKEVIYVGNSFNDIIGAKKAGLFMIWINRRKELLKNSAYLPDYEVKSLRLVPKIVKKIYSD